jgi:hypothetical protein
MNDDGGRLPAAPHSRPPAGPESSGKQVQQARTALRWFMLLLLGALLTSNLLLPWKVLCLVFSLAALAVGTVAFVRALRAKVPALLKVTAAVGLVSALFLSMGAGAAVILWPVTERYEKCMSTALTLQAQSTCEEQLRSLEELFRMSPGG